jgi:hypothetical protein
LVLSFYIVGLDPGRLGLDIFRILTEGYGRRFNGEGLIASEIDLPRRYVARLENRSGEGRWRPRNARRVAPRKQLGHSRDGKYRRENTQASEDIAFGPLPAEQLHSGRIPADSEISMQ